MHQPLPLTPASAAGSAGASGAAAASSAGAEEEMDGKQCTQIGIPSQSIGRF